MNDDFLYNNRPPVRKAFADRLYQRLQRKPDRLNQRKGVRFVKQSVLPVQVWKYALLTLIILMAFVFAISEPVRATALEWIRNVAGFTIVEQKQPDQPPINAEGQVLVTVNPIPTFSLPEALKSPPFKFGLPTWVPEGYVLDQKVAIGNSKGYVILLWHSPVQVDIEMLVEEGPVKDLTLQAGENSSEEVKINGQPALLVRGNWDFQNQWDPKGGMTIGWIKDDHHYRLMIKTHFEEDTAVIAKELVRMAESIP